MSLPGELGGDSSWKKERFGGIYLVYTGFLLPMLKIYFPHILKGTWRHRCSMHTKNLCSASTELMPFAINGHLNYPWFPPAWTVYLLCWTQSWISTRDQEANWPCLKSAWWSAPCLARCTLGEPGGAPCPWVWRPGLLSGAGVWVHPRWTIGTWVTGSKPRCWVVVSPSSFQYRHAGLIWCFSVFLVEGRITEKEISDHVSKETLFYICGPPPMTDFFSKQLENSHVPPEHICFEKWW